MYFQFHSFYDIITFNCTFFLNIFFSRIFFIYGLIFYDISTPRILVVTGMQFTCQIIFSALFIHFFNFTLIIVSQEYVFCVYIITCKSSFCFYFYFHPSKVSLDVFYYYIAINLLHKFLDFILIVVSHSISCF